MSLTRVTFPKSTFNRFLLCETHWSCINWLSNTINQCTYIHSSSIMYCGSIYYQALRIWLQLKALRHSVLLHHTERPTLEHTSRRRRPLQSQDFVKSSATANIIEEHSDPIDYKQRTVRMIITKQREVLR